MTSAQSTGWHKNELVWNVPIENRREQSDKPMITR